MVGDELFPSREQFLISSFVEERTERILDDVSTPHLSVLEFHPFSRDDADFFLLGGDDEEESVVQILLSDAIFIEKLEPDIKELVSLSMRKKNHYHLFSSLLFMFGKDLIEFSSFCFWEHS